MIITIWRWKLFYNSRKNLSWILERVAYNKWCYQLNVTKCQKWKYFLVRFHNRVSVLIVFSYHNKWMNRALKNGGLKRFKVRWSLTNYYPDPSNLVVSTWQAFQNMTDPPERSRIFVVLYDYYISYFNITTTRLPFATSMQIWNIFFTPPIPKACDYILYFQPTLPRVNHIIFKYSRWWHYSTQFNM